MLNKNAQEAEVLYGCVFAENFNSSVDVVKNSGTVTGTINKGKLYCVSGTGASFSASKIEDFLTYGGSLRVRWELNETGASSRPVLFYGIDVNYGIEILHKGSDGAINVQLRNGAGNNYYIVTGNVAAYRTADIVVTWNKAGTTLTLLVNGVYADNDATAGSGTYTMGTAYGAVQVGYATGLTPSTDIVIDEIRVYKNTIIAAFGSEGIALDYYRNSTFTYSKSAMCILPMTAATHDVVGVKTLDVSGRGKDAVFGDGSTATKFPTKLSYRGYSFDGGDYLQASNSGLVGASGLTIFVVVSNTPLGSQALAGIEKADATTVAGLIYKPDITSFRFYAGSTADANAANITTGLSSLNVVFGVSTGTVTSIYCNGKQGTNAATPIALVQDAAQVFTVGARGSADTPIIGDVLIAGYYPFALTYLQVIDATLKLKKQLNMV